MPEMKNNYQMASRFFIWLGRAGPDNDIAIVPVEAMPHRSGVCSKGDAKRGHRGKLEIPYSNLFVVIGVLDPGYCRNLLLQVPIL